MDNKLCNIYYYNIIIVVRSFMTLSFILISLDDFINVLNLTILIPYITWINKPSVRSLNPSSL